MPLASKAAPGTASGSRQFLQTAIDALPRSHWQLCTLRRQKSRYARSVTPGKVSETSGNLAYTIAQACKPGNHSDLGTRRVQLNERHYASGACTIMCLFWTATDCACH